MKSTVRTFEATAYKEGKWWMVSIPEIDGLTQAKNIAQIPEQATDLAAIILDVPADQVEVTVSYRLPEDAAAADQAWKAAQQQLTKARANVDATLAELVRTLKTQGYTLKDIGAMTGYTFQRIGQILKQGSDTEQETTQRMKQIFLHHMEATEDAKPGEEDATFSTVQLSGGNRVALLHTRTDDKEIRK